MRLFTARFIGLLLVVSACGGGPVRDTDESFDASLSPVEKPPFEERDAGLTEYAADSAIEAGRTSCALSSHCDDGDLCNGTESCIEGACVAGEPPCQNPDALHCDMSCSNKLGAFECVVRARDFDGDGFPDPACANEPGDDCSDTNAAVHPGAQELCDGLDNDCDALVDVDDGLLPLGENVEFDRGGQPAAAFSARGTFGVAYVQDDGVWLRDLDLGGHKVHEPALLSSAAAEKGNVTSKPSIAWGDDAFGVSWARGSELAFRRADHEGTPLADQVDLGPDGFASYGRTRVVHAGGEQWLVAFECCMTRPSVHARRILEGKSVAPPLYPISGIHSSALSGLAVSGTQVGAVWWRYYAATQTYFVEWTRRELDLELTDGDDPLIATATLPGSASQAVMAAAGDGWAIAWHETWASDATNHLRFAQFDGSGRQVCGPVDVDASYPAGAVHLYPDDIVATDRGFVIAARASSPTGYTVELVEMGPECRYRQRVPVASSSTFPYTTLARANSGELLLLWGDTAGEAKIMQRSFGPKLCE